MSFRFASFVREQKEFGKILPSLRNMAQIIRGHAMIPLSFQVSRTGMGLNIESLSLGSMPNVYSFNLEPATPPRDAANEPERNSAADFINFIQPSIPPDGCPNHSPELYLINESPRVIYVKAFLTEEERLHVLAKRCVYKNLQKELWI